MKQGCILSPYLFNLYAEAIMHAAGLDEETAGVKKADMKINNPRCADDTTIMAESVEDLERLLKIVKTHSAQAGLYLNNKKTKIMTKDDAKEFKIDVEKIEMVQSFNFLGSQISEDGSSSVEVKRRLSMARTALTNLKELEAMTYQEKPIPEWLKRCSFQQHCMVVEVG